MLMKDLDQIAYHEREYSDTNQHDERWNYFFLGADRIEVTEAHSRKRSDCEVPNYHKSKENQLGWNWLSLTFLS